MKTELAYVMITPYSLQKSRTGGIIARLLSRTDLEFIGAKMFAPTAEFVEKYNAIIKKNASSSTSEIIDVIASYIKESFSPYQDKYQRVMFLLFKGKNAYNKINETAGKLCPGIKTGETIRDTYSDYILNPDGSARYFEPAVIIPSSGTSLNEELKLFADFLSDEPNIIDRELLFGENIKEKRTLVIIKPDNWRYPSSRPGNIIDMLSKTGLRIVGCKLYRMSIEEALEFYGPVKGVLREKLAPKIGERAKGILEKELSINISTDSQEKLTESVGLEFADDQFSMIVEFMAGIRPEECPENEYPNPGKAKCLILIYQGENAVEKIRTVLGPTDPTKAPGGTIRRDFGTDVMVNTAHASDSFENAKREMKIVKINNNNIVDIITEEL